MCMTLWKVSEICSFTPGLWFVFCGDSHILQPCLFCSYETVTSMLMQSGPTEPKNPEDTESEKFKILSPEAFCDANLTEAPTETTKKHCKALVIEEDITTQITTSGPESLGQSLVDCLRLAALEVKREAESEKNNAADVTYNGKRTVRKVKISRESTGVGGPAHRDEQKPEACKNSELNIEKPGKSSPTSDSNTSPGNNNALGRFSSQEVPLLKEVEFDAVASKEPNAKGEPGEMKADLLKRMMYVSLWVPSESVEEELEFETGQEDVGTVWLAELYMDKG